MPSEATVCSVRCVAPCRERGGRDRGGLDSQPLRDVDRDQRDREHAEQARLPTASGLRSRASRVRSPRSTAATLGRDAAQSRRGGQLVIESVMLPPLRRWYGRLRARPMHILITEDEPLLARFLAQRSAGGGL